MLTQRLKNVIQKMEANSLLLLDASPAKIRNNDTEYPYRVPSNLYYITELNLSDSALLIQKNTDDNYEIRFYLHERSPEQERWLGALPAKEQVANHLSLSPKQIFAYENLFYDFSVLLKNRKVLYYEFGEERNLDDHVLSLLQKLNKNVRKGDFAPTRIIHCHEIFQEMRLRKDKSEIEKMRHAANVSALAHKELMIFSRRQPSCHEHQLQAFLEYQFAKSGATSLAYSSIVAGGKNSTFLHYDTNVFTLNEKKQVNANELLLVDAGCEWQGYSSDITRTFPLGGKFSPPQKQIYEIVYNAQQAAYKKCFVGSTLPEIHKAAVDVMVDGLMELKIFEKVPELNYLSKKLNGRENEIEWFVSPDREQIMEKELYRHFYMHSTSHFMGLDVHDKTLYFQDGKPILLQEGMVFSVEPGLYFSADLDFVPPEYRGIGIRIEDSVLITKDSMEILTSEAPSYWADIENL